MFLLEAAAGEDAPSTASIEFRVKVPASTPEAEQLYLWWNDRRILVDLEAGDAVRLRGLKVWFDMGTREGFEADGAGDEPAATGPVADARKLAGILDAAGWVIGRNYYYWEAAGARHDEEAWAERFPRVLTFLFGKTPGAE